MTEEYTSDIYTIRIYNKLNEIGRIARSIEHLANAWHLNDKVAKQINLVVEEVVSNIIFYAYSDADDHEIQIEFRKIEGGIFIIITDDGKYFNLLEKNNDVNINAAVEERKVGGLGIHILKNLADTIKYTRTDEQNIVELTKYF